MTPQAASATGENAFDALDQPTIRSDAKGQGGKGGNPRTLRTGPNDRRWAAHAPSLERAA